MNPFKSKPGTNIFSRRVFWAIAGGTIITIGAGIVVNTFLNKDIGCCIPTCEDKRVESCQSTGNWEAKWVQGRCQAQTNCEKGCCWLKGGATDNIPKSKCELDLGSWSKGKCGKGFSAHLEGTVNGQFDFKAVFGTEMGSAGEGILKIFGKEIPPMSIKTIYELYTCQDTIYSTWTGTIQTITTPSNGKEVGTPKPITVPFNESGRYKASGGTNLGQKIGYEAMIDEYSMLIKLDSGGMMPTIVAKGPIVKGAKKCESQ